MSSSSSFEDLKAHLHEMFQMDRGDLDFGIYRIMNSKRRHIEDFLANGLLPEVRSALEAYRGESAKEVQEELERTLKNLREAEADPSSSSKVKALEEKLGSSLDVEKVEKEVYSDLYTFFKRYYSEGDFMSLRRYKADVYALPYEGEEVKLHWANHDQYYIKTSENLKHYTFKVDASRRVRFEVVSAQLEKNDNKSASDKSRRFVLASEADAEGNPREVISLDGEQLTIRFELRPIEDNKKQSEVNKEMVSSLLERSECLAFDLDRPAPTDSKSERTLLEKHLSIYTAKFTFDYFIHHDLGSFLRRELDFFIKNEVMFLDDIEAEDARKVETYLARLKVLRRVAHKLIQFLAQIEDFQKKLWLKKKFVLETHYCVTLDKVIGTPEEESLLSVIAANEAQREEWVRLFALDEVAGYSVPLTEDFLKANDTLQVDTRFFDSTFKFAVLAVFDNLDEEIDGVLIASENFQALNLLQDRYQEQVKCIYIDPPYNAKTSEILYKNTFKHSSWMTMMNNRLELAREFQSDRCVFVVAIDEVEQEHLGQLISNNFPNYQKDCIVINCNPSGQQGDNFSFSHDYAFFVYPISSGTNKRFIGEQKRKNPEDWDDRNFRDVTGEDSLRTAGPNCFYPIIIKDEKIIGFGDVSHPDYHPSINESNPDGSIQVYPIDPEGVERKWRFERGKVENIVDELHAHYLSKRNVYDIKRLKKKFNFKSNWISAKYSSNNHGTQLLNKMIVGNPFMFPKSIHTVSDCVDAALTNNNKGLVLDYFAGSGTTGHAAINLNRQDNGTRKYILVEMGTYCNSITKPRIQKAAYASAWKNGKPVDRDGVSQVLKYMALEQYEDTLDNLEMEDRSQFDLLKNNPELKDDFTLGYMMNVESKDSPSLLNISRFNKPFDYTLNITNDDETEKIAIDLIETFNYLIGLRVQKIRQHHEALVTVEGQTPEGEKTLIIWRDIDAVDRDTLDQWFQANYNRIDFDVVYVNGDNNLGRLKHDDQDWDIRLTEEEFNRRMFDAKEI